MKRLIWLMAVLIVASAARVSAYDVVIDDFANATNTGVVQSFFGVAPNPNTASDTGLEGVIGGSRDLAVESTSLFAECGVIAGSLLDYMSSEAIICNDYLCLP